MIVSGKAVPLERIFSRFQELLFPVARLPVAAERVMDKAVIYTRQSSEENAGPDKHSQARQESACKVTRKMPQPKREPGNRILAPAVIFSRKHYMLEIAFLHLVGQAYAQSHGIEIVAVFQDAGHSRDFDLNLEIGCV